MRTRKRPLTPLAATVAGLAAGAVGTVSMDAVRYVRYRRAGGKDTRLRWNSADWQLPESTRPRADRQTADRGLHPA